MNICSKTYAAPECVFEKYIVVHKCATLTKPCTILARYVKCQLWRAHSLRMWFSWTILLKNQICVWVCSVSVYRTHCVLRTLSLHAEHSKTLKVHFVRVRCCLV